MFGGGCIPFPMHFLKDNLKQYYRLKSNAKKLIIGIIIGASYPRMFDSYFFYIYPI